MWQLHTGENKMAPLSDFTVTLVNHIKPPKVKMDWHDWCDREGFPDYDLDDGVLTFHTQKEPEDVEIVMPHREPPYQLVWAK